MTLLTVLVDSREPKNMQNFQIGNLKAITQTLPTGDAWLACDDANLIVERKTPGDLLASIADGRLFEQCNAMAVASPWSYLVITGTMACQNGCVIEGGQLTKWTWRSLQGALLTIQELGIEIVYCDGDQDYPSTLEWLANRKRDPIKIKSARRSSVMQSPAEILLCALPGISERRAADLMKYCGTTAWAINYLTHDDNPNRVPGVGPGTRKRARQVFGLADNEYLGILIEEDGKYSEKEYKSE